MKLFFSPGACSLSVHIVARELGLDLELVKMNGKTHTLPDGTDYYTLNPKGSVPALQLDDGQVLTEGAVIVQYLADQQPQSGLAPKHGTMERYRLQEWLNFIATDLHKQLSPLYNPKVNDEGKAALKQRFVQRLEVVAKQLTGRSFLLGDTLTVADPYLFTILSWTKRFEVDLTKWPAIDAFMARMRERPAVKAALAAEAV
jgi:glutathione S-transferase